MCIGLRSMKSAYSSRTYIILLRMNVALATSQEFPNLCEGDAHLLDAIKAKGIKVSGAIWSDKSIDWSEYSHVIIRSCWDYHLRIKEFLSWITHLEKAKVTVFNRPEIIRWNSNKSYLLDLKKRGVTIPETRIVTLRNVNELPNIIKEFSSKEIVIKPSVGADAYEVRKFAHSDPRVTTYVKQLLQHSDVLIQEFITEIANGEISVIFLGNELSHAVIKTPRKDDYRSNRGGHIQHFELSEEMKLRLIDVYTRCNVMTLYARVDVIDTGNELVLIELELIDTELFFEYDEKSANLFVDKLIALRE